MKLSIQTLSNIYCEHLWVELSDSDLKQAKPNPQDYSNETGQNYAYLNRLCLNAFLKWMQENLGLETAVFPNEKVLPKVWQFVNGCGINLGSKRLVLIPSDAIDIADFAVPGEWVNIPNFAADYYLPARVDLEEEYIHFWGFVTRKTLIDKAEYNSIYRLYYMQGDYVIPNLEILGAGFNLCDESEVAALPKLSETEAEDLMEELSKPSPYSPRLKAKFEKWGALLNESYWLEKLYERCVQPVPSPSMIWVLNRWLDGVVEAGWQTFEELFNAKIAPAVRAKQVRLIELETPENIKRAVRQLYDSQSEVALPANIEDRNVLVHLLQNTQDESVRWKAAEYLWTIDPNHPGAIRRVMDLGVYLMGHHIALMVGVLRKLDGVAVLLRVYPMRDSRRDSFARTKLPPGLRLIGLWENGNPIPGLEAVARSEPQDDYISLYFSADVGDRFNVRLTLENISITEQFIV